MFSWARLRRLGVLDLFQTPLSDEMAYAAKHGNLKRLKKLLKENPSAINHQNNVGTLLHIAAINGQNHIAAHLITYDAIKVDSLNDYSFTPLCVAAYNNNYELCKLLLEHGANVNVQGHHGESPLMMAVIYGDIKLVNLLLRKEANPNIVDNLGSNTPIHYAAELGDLAKVKSLVKYGANINAKTGKLANNDGRTYRPLHRVLNLHEMPDDASIYLQNYFVSMTERRYKTERRGDYQYTPLHLAGLTGNEDIINYFLSQKSIVRDARDSGGYKPSQLASEQDHQHIVEIFNPKKSTSIRSSRKRKRKREEDGSSARKKRGIGFN